ncbi:MULTISPECIES: glutathione S-transferase family protein [unclassified Caulobacter]|uniref:glutathione S-transferase family protein n=1 Tax=unclassified Caulobacter TaxID=2648921 RepID=UPI0007865846|nr:MULTISPECIES: glutathione S-transferase family protein [unclassified Caulobacter]AZS22172.1 glutathione S-transferase family protein [Caulobacter sp. FWC26]
MELVIGTKRWSTWSLRPWLVLKRAGVDFAEIEIELRRGDATGDEIGRISPSRLAPALRDGDLVIWDSLAICEYLAEKFPDAKLWPDDPTLRALGRSACAEMHSGFQALRSECPMALDETPRAFELSEAAEKNVRRIVALWTALLARSHGPFLLGAWSIADAFYTPVATRFRTYGVKLADYGDAGAAQAYSERLLETPEFLAWERAAQAG